MKEALEGELMVKDKIIKRHADYIETLKKELVYAKIIIKNP
jgi:hypothetical protein